MAGRAAFTFADARDLAALDRAAFDRLVANGYFVVVRPGVYALTARGRAAVEQAVCEAADAGHPKAA